MHPFVYLDADSCNARIVRRLESHGIDVVLGTQDGMEHASDESHLQRATDLGRPIVTANYGDFIRISRQRAAAGNEHGGIIIWTQNVRSPESVADSVVEVLRERSEGGLRNALIWV